MEEVITVSGIMTTVSGICITPELEDRMRTLANYVVDRIFERKGRKYSMITK